MFPDTNHRPSGRNQLTVLHLIHERTALNGVSQCWKNVFGEEVQCVVSAQLQQERTLSYTSASPCWPVTPPYAHETVGSSALTLYLPHCSTKCWYCALEVWLYTCVKHRVRSSNLYKHIFLSTESIQQYNLTAGDQRGAVVSNRPIFLKPKGSIMTCVTIWMNLLEFVKVLFLKVLQLCKPICASRTCWCVVVFANYSTACDRKTVCVMYNLWSKAIRQAVHRTQLCRS